MSKREITVYKLDHKGALIWDYSGHVLERSRYHIRLEAFFNVDYAEAGPLTLRHGDRMLEWFFTNRWYNIFEIHGERGIKGWYCNITRPAVFDAESVRSDDLALDVTITPQHTIHIMDEEEYHALNLPQVERRQVNAALAQLRHQVRVGVPPFSR